MACTVSVPGRFDDAVIVDAVVDPMTDEAGDGRAMHVLAAGGDGCERGGVVVAAGESANAPIARRRRRSSWRSRSSDWYDDELVHVVAAVGEYVERQRWQMVMVAPGGMGDRSKRTRLWFSIVPAPLLEGLVSIEVTVPLISVCRSSCTYVSATAVSAGVRCTLRATHSNSLQSGWGAGWPWLPRWCNTRCRWHRCRRQQGPAAIRYAVVYPVLYSPHDADGLGAGAAWNDFAQAWRCNHWH